MHATCTALPAQGLHLARRIRCTPLHDTPFSVSCIRPTAQCTICWPCDMAWSVAIGTRLLSPLPFAAGLPS